jgi:glycosyltransferase involved in cell wall biosynthesis
MQKTISIVIAIFNRKDELFELLNSLIAQTDKNFEVIIVDDGSSVDLLPTVETFKEMLEIQYFKKNKFWTWTF